MVGNILTLLGGIGAFLFGMKYMGEGLERVAGARMKDLMEKLTRNPVKGFLLGMLVTVVIQSSAATTVMVMGLINAGIMDLAQAAGVIIGANIGTTITSVLIALDISAIAPFCIFAGAVLMLYFKKDWQKHLGQIILGFGILFQGLHTMSGAMSFLQDMPAFKDFVASATHPVVGLLVGILMAAVMQSSSAAVGVVQVLALDGLMPLAFAGYLVCGINIGSSVPPFLSAINARNNAKRAAWIYLIYNVIGAIIFVPITLLTPYTDILAANVPSAMFQVSVYHIVFKVVTAVVLMPLINWLVSLSYRFVPKVDHEGEMRLEFIDVNLIAMPEVSVSQALREVERMANLVQENLDLSVYGLIHNDISQTAKIAENEETINWLNENITNFLVKLNALEFGKATSETVGQMFHVVNDLERIGDHLIAISKKTQNFCENGLIYSQAAQAELQKIYEKLNYVYGKSVESFLEDDLSEEEQQKLKDTEKEIDMLTIEAQDNHIARLQAGECETEPGIIYAKALHDLERIGDYSMNIAFASKPEPAITGAV